MTVFVVGSLHLDVVVRAPRLPKIDETVTGNAVDYVFGGKGGNQALAVARVGGKVGLAGRIGADGFGNIIRQKLTESCVDTSLLQLDDGPSGMSVAIINAEGDYGAVIVSAANLHLEAEKIKLPHDTSIVLLQNEVTEVVNVKTAVAANEMGAKVWLNAAPARALPERLLANVDLMIVNRMEAAFYDPLPQPTTVLKTLGADGVEYNGKVWEAPKVEVVSTHGAGDMFIGALAASVDDGAKIEDAIGFAQTAAAWHVSTPADKREATSTEELLKRLKRQLNA